MKKYELIESTQFGEIEADIYSDQKDMFMTAEQLCECLKEKRTTFDMRISRNTYLKEPEFSVSHKLLGTDGKSYKTRLFTEDGIYEITMLSKSKKAREFRQWVRGILKQLRSGKLMLTDGNIVLSSIIIESAIQKHLGFPLADIQNQLSTLTEKFNQMTKTQDFMGRTLFNAFYTPTEQNEWKREMYRLIRSSDPENPDPRWNVSPILHRIYPIVFNTLGIDQEIAKTEYKERNNTEKFVSTIDVIAEQEDMRKIFESLAEDYVAECLNRCDVLFTKDNPTDNPLDIFMDDI